MQSTEGKTRGVGADGDDATGNGSGGGGGNQQGVTNRAGGDGSDGIVILRYQFQ